NYFSLTSLLFSLSFSLWSLCSLWLNSSIRFSSSLLWWQYVEAVLGGLVAVRALAGGVIERLAVGAAELDVGGVLGGGDEGEASAVGGEDVGAGFGPGAGGGDDPAVGGDGHAVDSPAAAEVVQDAGMGHCAVGGIEVEGQERPA